jgi:polyisoprenoid-binding protein YceI
MKTMLLLVLALTPAWAQRVDLEIDPAATTIGWTLGDVLHTVHGTFHLQKGGIWFDSAAGKAGGLLVVDAKSGESGSGARDGRMHKNVLESAKYPEIAFAPDGLSGPVAANGDSEVEVHGVFTIHGAGHELTAKVKTHAEPGKMTATLTFNVPYVKWGMKDPSTFVLKVKDFVTIDLQTTARVR